jgi:hypothetical protein
MNDDNVFVGLALVNVKDAKLVCKKNKYLDEKIEEMEVGVGESLH